MQSGRDLNVPLNGDYFSIRSNGNLQGIIDENMRNSSPNQSHEKLKVAFHNRHLSDSMTAATKV